MNVLGVDLSSKAIDLVLLDENANRAQWTHVPLTGPTAFERVRDIGTRMPSPSWYDAYSVYLCAIEQPFGVSRRGQAVLMLTMGAVLAGIPRSIETWNVNVSTWKQHLGLGSGKPNAATFSGFSEPLPGTERPITDWPQDALDALGVALYARELNAAGIAKTLQTNTQGVT